MTSICLTDQNSFNLVISHINSTPIEKFGGKSPLEVASFMYPDLYEKLIAYGIKEIEKELSGNGNYKRGMSNSK